MSAIATPQRPASVSDAPCALKVAGRRSGIPRWAALWLVALLALTIATRLADPTGWLGSDDAAYYSAAEHVLTGTPITRLHHHYARMAIILPIAASVALFGHTTWAVALPMLIASIICVILVVILGRVVWDWWEGLLAGTIVSLLPYFRILSTTAFPDVHVCMWSTAAMLLAVAALRTRGRKGPVLLFVASGFATGSAVSAKVLAASVVIGIAALVWQEAARTPDRSRSQLHRPLPTAIASFACGGLLFLLIEGLFYSHAANDFLFSLHAHEHSQAGAPDMVADDDPLRLGVFPMIRDRMTLLLYPSVSGWGIIGAFFWPAVLMTLLFDRAGRGLALWAAATYLLVSFMPVSFAEGYQPYPIFHGRHILPACVPFALCLAWSVRSLSTFLLRESWTRVAWPVLAAAVVAISLVNPRELNGFRDRPTGRFGTAISQIVAHTNWDADRPIVMTPSVYWRYRILFPEPFRSRLRVAADPDSPTWWRDTTVDIVARSGPLPAPNRAYLIVTPRQLAGGAETWDYDVTLPRDELSAWQQVPPTVTMVRDANRDIGPVLSGDVRATPIVMLMGGADSDRPAIGERNTPFFRP